MPHPEARESWRSKMFPIKGGKIKASTTRVRFFGKSQHPATPIHSNMTCAAPEGAVYSIV